MDVVLATTAKPCSLCYQSVAVSQPPNVHSAEELRKVCNIGTIYFSAKDVARQKKMSLALRFVSGSASGYDMIMSSQCEIRVDVDGSVIYF